MRQLFQTLLKKRIRITVIRVFFQFIKKRNITEIFLYINCLLFIHYKNFRHRAITIFKMPAEMNESLILLCIDPVSSYERSSGSNNAEINANAARLRDFVYADDVFIAE